MAAMASQATTDQELPELVRDSMLPVVFDRDLTIHPQPFTRRNKSKEEKWVRETNLGRGGYGEVWLEKKIEGNDSLPKLRAVKTIRIPENETIFELNGGRGVRELEALAKFSQDNYKDFFVKSYGWYLAPGSLNIAMEYCRHGDLKGYLERVKTISTQEVQEIALQILGALESMHRNGFAHRDLKPANILIKAKPPQEWWVKLCDFGLSKRQEGQDEASTVRGTPSFMPPETLGFPFAGNPKKANPYFADLWCFGETLYRCHVGGATFEDKEQLYEYQCGNRLFPIEKLQQAKASGLATNFIHFLMLPNPAERLDTDRARRHPWLRGEVEPPSGQVINAYRPSHQATGPTRVARSSTAPSPYTAAETQLTEASGQWSTTVTNPNLQLRRTMSQLSLADNSPSMAYPGYYGRPHPYSHPDIVPNYPVYPPTPSAPEYANGGTPQEVFIVRGPERITLNRTLDLLQRFDRLVVKKKSRQKETKQAKVTQAPTGLATPSPKPRQSLPNPGQTLYNPPSFQGSARQPPRTPNQEQGYRATPPIVLGNRPGSSVLSPPPPLTPYPLEPTGSLWPVFQDSRANRRQLELMRAEVNSIRRSMGTQGEDGLPPRMRAQPSDRRPAMADLPQSPQEQCPAHYRPPVSYRDGLGGHASEVNQPPANRKPSTEARPGVYPYGPIIMTPARSEQQLRRTRARSEQQLRRTRSHHSPPPPRNTTQYPAHRSVDRKAHPYESSDSEDEWRPGDSVPMTSEYFGGQRIR